MSTDADAAAAVFELLSDETRVDIVTALHRRRLRRPAEPTLAFSALADRVDVDDSGQFNYHLDRLRGALVEKREEGYALTSAGVAVGRLVADGSEFAETLPEP